MFSLCAYPIRWEGISLEDRLRAMRAAGFTSLCAGSSKGFLPDAPAETLTISLAEKLGFPIENVHLDGRGSHSLWAEGAEGDDVCARYMREIDLCADAGVLCGVTHVTWGVEPPPSVSQIGLDRFRRMADRAAKRGFRLALENSVSAMHLRAVLDGISCEYVGYCFDSGHARCFCPEEDFLADYGDRLFATHMQDNDGARDLHMLPMDGCAPFDHIAKILPETALRGGSVTLEVAGVVRRECPGQSADEVREGLRRLAIANDERLLRVYAGGFAIYEDLSFEAYLERAAHAALKIAQGA